MKPDTWTARLRLSLPLVATAIALLIPSITDAAVSPQCGPLEQELASHMASRSGNGQQVSRIDRAIAEQQQELNSITRQSQQMGCERRGFFIFQPRRPPQCFQIEGQMDEMQDNLASLNRQRQNLVGGNRSDPVRDRLMQSLGRYQCGPQYRRFAPRGRARFRFFRDPSEGIISRPRSSSPQGGRLLGDITTYRTLCVRTCDGYYFPISFSTLPSRFGEDAGTCNSMCPTSDVQLYVHPNPGGSIEQMTTTEGQSYEALDNAWRFRNEVVRGCSCNSTTLQLEASLDAQAARERQEAMVTGDQEADGDGDGDVPPSDTARNSNPAAPGSVVLGNLPLRDLDQSGPDSNATKIEARIAAKNGNAPEPEVDKAHINSRFATSADDVRKDFSETLRRAGDKSVLEIDRNENGTGKNDNAG
ncbi:MAG: DUF2865 domain-containing protein [Rhizobiales bacterium]|nr:DUF2865 domain-containing protein [Hyphomicrobiales bacterium]